MKKSIIFKTICTPILMLVFIFSFLIKDTSVTFASSNPSFNYIDIVNSNTTYDTYNNQAIITILCSDLKGLDYKKSTITLLNKNNEEEIISLYDGKVVEIDDGNYVYGEYNTSGFMAAKILDNTLKIYIAARETNDDFSNGDDVTLNYKVYLVNSCNQSDSHFGEFVNKYIDYKVLDYDLDSEGTTLNLSFDSKNSINKKITRSIYNAGTHQTNVMDYYGNVKTLEFVIAEDYDFATKISFSQVEETYQNVTIEISKVPYNIVVSEEFYEDIYLNKEDIISKKENELVDVSNVSYYIDNNGLYRFHKSSIVINSKPGLYLVYRVDSGLYEDDFEYYTANSYLINGERSIGEYNEEYEYSMINNEPIIVDIIEGSPMLEYIQLQTNGYVISSGRISVENNNSYNVNVTAFENTEFKYKYVDYNMDEFVKDIKVSNIISANPVVNFSVNVGSYNIDSNGDSYLYGNISAHLEDDHFSYVDKNTNLPISYTFTPFTSNTYIIDKDNVKILYNGVETNLVLKEDVLIQLPVDKLLSLTTEDTNDPSQPQQPEHNNDPIDNGNDTNPAKDGLKLGVIIAISLASMVVVSIGSFACFWFVIKKRSWKQLINIFRKKN